MNILIIDDDAEDTSLFCEALIELYPNAKCCAVNRCERIEQTVDEVQPDVIFMDGQMYPISGKECFKMLNELVDRKKVKVVIHSGSLSPEEVDEFRAAGIDDVLLKANSYRELKANITGIIEKYNLGTNS